MGECGDIQAAEVAREGCDLVGNPGRPQAGQHALDDLQHARAERNTAEGQPGHTWDTAEYRHRFASPRDQHVLPVSTGPGNWDLRQDLLEDKRDYLPLVSDVAFQVDAR